VSEASGTLQPAEQAKPDHIGAILSALGGQPVLLPIHAGEKGPKWDAWERLTWEDTQNPETVLKFSAPKRDSAGDEVRDEKGNVIREVYRQAPYRELLAAGNVGVRLGCASKLRHGPDLYYLCSIDIDEDDQVEPFLALNPRLKDTLRTRGSRGCNFWLWVLKDSSPHFGKITFAKRTDEKTKKPLPWGEWRADGINDQGEARAFQTVIYGRHPSGCRYQRVSDAAKPLLIDFTEIKWPLWLNVPWRKSAIDELIEKHGKPWFISDKGAIHLNPPFWVAKYALEHDTLFEPDETRFYDYSAERGLWLVESEDKIRWKLSGDFKKVADEAKLPQLETKRTNSFLQSIVELLKGCTEKRDAFRREAGIVHLQNWMLDLRGAEPKLVDFAKEFYSRNQLAVAYDEKATCPRFEEELLRGGLEREEDIRLLQKLAGQLLLGVNLTQKIVLLTGRAGRGKTTLIDVLAEVIGRANYVGLRTEHLHQRFELWNYVGKTMLIGADVPGHFLMTEGAHVLKALVGKDVLTAEKKNGESVTIIGDYNVWLSSNSRLKVRLDGDADAWRRRLIIVKYEREAPAVPNPRFLEELLASEASGILNWMIAGAIQLLKELRETGRIVMDDAQRDRVDSLLSESDSVREFVRKGIAPSDGAGSDATTQELISAYVRFCEVRTWNPLPARKVEQVLTDLMLEIHRMARRNDIQRDGKAQRGYRGLRVLPLGDRGDDAPAAAVAAVAPEPDDGGPFG
jgi:P4 family phage/plasmid primase-like protien